MLAETLGDGRVLLAVADGMGGHAAGEVASALAIAALREGVAAGCDLGEACRRANRRVHAAAAQPGKTGMGTTLVAALVDGREYLLANVGDSRGYLVTIDGVRQLTADHSFVAEAMRRGQTEAEARGSPYRDVLTRSIGADAEVEVDLVGPHPLEENFAIILCSDGFSKSVDDDRLWRLFATAADASAAARALASAALEAGSDDNITVVVAEHGRVPRSVAVGGGPARGTPTQRMTPIETPIETTPDRVAETERSSPRWWAIGALAAVLLVVAAFLLRR